MQKYKIDVFKNKRRGNIEFIDRDRCEKEKQLMESDYYLKFVVDPARGEMLFDFGDKTDTVSVIKGILCLIRNTYKFIKTYLPEELASYFIETIMAEFESEEFWEIDTDNSCDA